MGRFENRTWGSLLLRGFLALAFGIFTMARPGISAAALLMVFGAYAFVDGIFSLIASFKVAELHGRWWPMLLVGLCGIAIGILTFTNPVATAVVLIYYIAFWAIFTGVFEVVAAFRLRKVVQGEWALGVAGLLTVAFGLMVLARPAAGILGVIFLIGAYAIVFGLLLIALGLRLRSFHSERGHHLQPA
jgi:uncharacterized membrane protein HdeD (DUF308 family)